MKFVSCILLSLIAAATAFSQCPKFEVVEPTQPVNTGEVMQFRVRSIVKTNQQHKYVWTVDRGKIVKGQGTANIAVSTEGLENTTVTARVNVTHPRSRCSESYQGSGIIAALPACHFDDELGNLPVEHYLARLDLVLARANRLNATLIIANYGDEKTIRDREKAMAFYSILIRNFDPRRIVFAAGQSEAAPRTVYWLSPNDISKFCGFRPREKPLTVKYRGGEVDLNSEEAKKYLRQSVCPLLSLEDRRKDRVAGLCSGVEVPIPNTSISSGREFGPDLILSVGTPIPRDIFGGLAPGEIIERTIVFVSDLAKNKESTALIVNSGVEDVIRERELFLAKFFQEQGVIPKRITFARGSPEGEIKTVLWLIPKGADHSDLCLDCETTTIEQILGRSKCPDSIAVDFDDKSGDERPLFRFKGVVLGIDKTNLTYSWTTRSGKIVEGQGTDSVLIRSNKFRSADAELEVKGLAPKCKNNKASASIYFGH